MSGGPSARAIEHAFAELKKLHLDRPNRPRRHAAPGTKRGIDYYGVFELVTAIAFGADLFKWAHQYWPDMHQPRSFSEHVFAYKYLGEFPFPSLGDKLAARVRVEQAGLGALLPPLYWRGTDLRPAGALQLPAGQYYLKANHGSGLNHRLRSAAALADELEGLVKKTQGWLRMEWGRHHGEWQYACFPRQLFIEGFIDFSGPEQTPDDYKFYCFNGKVRMIQIDTARFAGHKRGLYTPDWRLLPVRIAHPTHETGAPDCLGEMIAIAETLSAGLRFLRVDLYTDGRRAIRFGEMTLTPYNAAEAFSNPEFDMALGRYFDPEPSTEDPVGAWLAKQ